MESTIQFIDVIKRHEPIYDTTHKDYKNMERKANAWMSISNEVGLSVEACKRKWKNLRDSYTKYLRSYRAGTKTSKKYQYWAHADHMDFLRPFQGPGRSQVAIKVDDIFSEFLSIKNDVSYDLNYEMAEKSSDNINNIDIHRSVEQSNNGLQHHIPQQQNSVASSTSLSSSIDDRNLIKQIELDATSMFFLSLAKSVRGMPRKYQADVKMRCMKIVSDVEMELENTMFTADNNYLSLNNRQLKNHHKFNGQEIHQGSLLYQQQQQQQLNHQTDNSEHFLYVMSPSRVEAMIDISSDDEQTDSKN